MSDFDQGTDAPVVSNESDQPAATPENVATPIDETQAQPEVKTEAEKTLTQAEVNAIVQREKAKAEAKAERRYQKEQRELLERFIHKPEQPKSVSAPKLEEYEDIGAYLEARDAWNEERITSKLRDELQQQDQRRSAQAERAKSEAAWADKLKKAQSEFPDLTEVLSESEAPMSPAMAAAIREADNGPRIARFLAMNPQEAERIFSLSPVRQAAAILKLDEAPPVKASAAPPPLSPVGGKGSGSKDPTQMSDKEFAEWRNKVKKARS